MRYSHFASIHPTNFINSFQTLIADTLRLFAGTRVIREIYILRWLLRSFGAGLKSLIPLILIISITATSTPAMTIVAGGLLSDVVPNVKHWWNSSQVAESLRQMVSGQHRPSHITQEEQSERDARVARIEIEPQNVTVRVGESINFAAIAYDSNDTPIGGVGFNWHVSPKRRAGLSHQGEFMPGKPGDFEITVEGAGREGTTRATALPRPRKRRGERPIIREIDSRFRPGTLTSFQSRNQNLKRESIAESDINTISRSDKTLFKPAILKSGNEPKGTNSLTGIESTRALATKVAFAPPQSGTCSPLGYTDQNFQSTSDPLNRRGMTSGTPPDQGVSSASFNIDAPVLTLPGRGIDLNLSLSYNSRTWFKANSQITYDIDRDWPAPGWSLGFGKILAMGTQSGYMIIDADATHHPYHGTPSLFSTSQTFSGNTADGTLIDYTVAGSSVAEGGAPVTGEAKLPGGTIIKYGAPGQRAIYPIQIKDQNGNYLTITYVNNSGPQISTITDTLGHIVRFFYDSNGLLTAITAPPFGGTGADRTLLRLHYKQATINASFAPGLQMCVSNPTRYLIDAIYYPATSTGYWFGDADSYSSYGMIAKVSEQRGLSFTNSPLNNQGIITPHSPVIVSHQSVYNYQLTPDSTLTDAPFYTTRTDSWEAMNTAPVVTSYEVNKTLGWSRIVRPDGLTQYQWFGLDPNQINYGLLYLEKLYDSPALDSTETELSSNQIVWQGGAYFTRVPQQTISTTKATRHTLSSGVVFYNGYYTQTDYTYDNLYNRVLKVQEKFGRYFQTQFQSPSTIRTTVKIYESSSGYINRHILNLVNSEAIYEGDGSQVSQRLSLTEYQHDVGTLIDTPGVIQHDDAYNPDAPVTETDLCSPGDGGDGSGPGGGIILPPDGGGGSDEDGDDPEPNCETTPVSAYDPSTNARGNTTAVTVYTNAYDSTSGGPTGGVTNYKQYDITGNLRIASTSCCQQTSLEYTSATQYGYPTKHIRGSASDTTAQISKDFTYDFGTGLVISTQDADDLVTNTVYDPVALRLQKETHPTGASVTYQYNDPDLTRTTISSASNNYPGSVLIEHYNGLGRITREEAAFMETSSTWTRLPNGEFVYSGGTYDYDIVDTQYDNVGRVSQQTRPYRLNHYDVVTYPPGPVDPRKWTIFSYDKLDRITTVTSPDNSIVRRFYDELSVPDAATSDSWGPHVRSIDQWGRERWVQFDGAGRISRVIEPNPDGNGKVASNGLLTTYGYNALDQLTSITQGDQIRSFKYDSLGRLTRKKMAEADATLNDGGQYVGANGVWSEAFTYDDQSNLTSQTDARGVQTNFSYSINGSIDPLNRLQSVSYTVPTNLASTVPNAPTVSYQYFSTGDLTRIAKVIDGGGTIDFSYDAFFRVSEKRRTFTGLESYQLSVRYTYDSLGRLTKITYPTEYGATGYRPAMQVSQSYDLASRTAEIRLSSNGDWFSAWPEYNATSQITTMNIWSFGGIATAYLGEKYDYDSDTGLLTRLRLNSSATPLLDLSYSYQRNSGSAGTLNGVTGQLTQITNNLTAAGIKDRTYQYDALGRLKMAKGGTATTPAWTQIYNYDRYGNRTGTVASGTAADGTAIPTDGLPNALSYSNSQGKVLNNRITTAPFEYDAAGSQTRAKLADGTIQRYDYDAAGRLSRVLSDDRSAVIASFTYGASNHRLSTTEGGTTTYYARDGDNVIAEYVKSVGAAVLTKLKSYFYFGEQLIATIGLASDVQFYHPDRLGTRIITDINGNFVSEQVGLPFGTGLDAESAGQITNRRFTSYERSQNTKLDYAVNRFYSPQQGRFTQPDPIGMNSVDPMDPQTLNQYAYCANDPVNRNDPSGQGWLGSFFRAVAKVIIAVAVVVAAILMNNYIASIAPGCYFNFQGGSSVMFPFQVLDIPVASGGGPVTALAMYGLMRLFEYRYKKPPAPSVTPVRPPEPTSPPEKKCDPPLAQLDSDVQVIYEQNPRMHTYFSPDFASKLSDAIRELNKRGITPTITSAYRTEKDQEFMRNGGSGSNPYAKGPSLHQAGFAVDISNGQSKIIREVMIGKGFTWGGVFRSKPDKPHFEINIFGIKRTAGHGNRLKKAAAATEVSFNDCYNK